MALFHAHCHLQNDPIAFDGENSQIFVDDCNAYLVVYKLGIFTVTSVQARHIPPQTIDFIRRGPVLDVRFSLDKRHVCIQRSSTDIDFVSLQDATEVAYQCREKGRGNSIHGFVWCNTTLCDLCLITEMGLELVKLSPKLDGVKLVKHEKRSVDWFHYYHPCRTLLLCSGKDHSCLQTFQFLPDKLLKLPDFDPEVAIAPGGRRSRLEHHSITLCKLYDKLCCVYVFAARQEMLVYQLGKEAIGKLCTVNLFSACDSYAVSVCDHLLVVHNTDSRITMIFDIWLQQWTSHPVAAPLPLGGPPARVHSAKDEEAPEADGHNNNVTAGEYVTEWQWVAPNYILDKQEAKMWSIDISLEHISASSSDKVNLLRCLLKRAKGRPHVLDLLRTCIRERESLHTLYQMFSIVIECARQAVAPATPKSSKWYFYDPEDEAAGSPSEASGDSGEGEGAFGSSVGKREKGPATNVLEQGDMHQEVLLRVCSEESVDGDYLIAVVTEYLRSLSAHGQMAEALLVEFLLKLIMGAHPPRYHVLHQLLQYHVIQDSIPVAERLLELEDKYPPALQLSLDMIHRLGASQKVADVLLSRGKLIQAMRYLKDHPQVVIPAAVLLEAARCTHDIQTFFVTYRFVQSQHAQHFASRRRSSSDFVKVMQLCLCTCGNHNAHAHAHARAQASDKCDHHVEFFFKSFGCN